MIRVSHATRLFGSLAQRRIEDGVGDLVGDLVRVASVTDSEVKRKVRPAMGGS